MRKRLVVVSLAGAALLALFVQWSDMSVGGTMAAGPYPPLGACLFWALLVASVRVVHRFSSRELLTRSEKLAVFAVWAAANMVVGRGMVHPLLTSLVGPIYYARTGLALKAVHQHLPDWLAIRSSSAAVHFFEGYGLPVPWSVWRTPLAAWGLFFVPFLIANVCLCALFETYWVRHERLAFPLVSLPIEALSQGGGSDRVSQRRMFAVGAAVPILLHGFGVAHAYMPAIPCVPFYNEVSYLAAAPPWTAARPLYLNLYPLLIGITFLAPTDVTLSVWFFLLLTKVELVAAAATGWSEGASGGAAASPPYLEEQSAGAYLALAAVLVWSARRHLAATVRGVVRRRRDQRTAAEDLDAAGHRLAAIGFVAGLAVLLVWTVWTGWPLWFALAFFAFYFAVALVLSRLMAESGISWLLAPILPDKLIFSLTGSAAVSQQMLTRLTLHVQHLRDTRQLLAPAVFQAGRLREEANVRMRPFYALLLAAVAVAIVVGTAAALPTFYQRGALSMTANSDGMMMTAGVIPVTGVNQLSSRLLSPVRPSTASAVALCVGAGFTVALSALRARCLWWPLNPLGYALTGTLQAGYANKMLLSVVLGWTFKSLTMRFGGANGFRLLRSVALGLIFGDLAVGGVLKLLDALLGPSGYAIF
jgi:hypothetical protein